MKKKLTMIAALALAVCIGIGGTMAYLTASTSTITNTFTVGNVAINLTETGAVENAKSYKVSPGSSYAKDPTVTVTANSDKCYVFVKVDANNASDISWSVRNGWTQLGTDSVWYRIVDTSTDAQVFPILTAGTVTGEENGHVTVSEDVTNGNLNATLAFTAYAIQYAGFEDNASGAWTEVSAAANS